MKTKLTIPEEMSSKPMVFLTVGQAFDFFDLYCEDKAKVLISPKKVSSSADEHLNYAKAVAFLQISRPVFEKVHKAGKIKGIQVSETRILFKVSNLVVLTHE